MTNKNLRIVIIILTCIVVIIFGYMYFQDKQLDKQAAKKEKEIRENKKNEVKKETKEVEIALDSDIAKQAEESTSKIGSYTRYINYDPSKLSKRNLIDTALNGLSITFCISNRSQIKATITLDDLNKALGKYILNAKITLDDIKSSAGETSLTVKDYGFDQYSIVMEDEAIHVIAGCDGRGQGLLAESVISAPVKAMTKGDVLYIYRKVAFGKIGGSGYNYYKDESKTEFVETLPINTNPTWNNYNTYISTYEKSDGTYYLVSTDKE